MQLTINFISAACVRVFNIHKTSLIMIYYLSINKYCIREVRRESSRIMYNIIIPGTYHYIRTKYYYCIASGYTYYSCIIFLPISNQFKYYLVIRSARIRNTMKLFNTEWYYILIQLQIFCRIADHCNRTFLSICSCLRTIWAYIIGVYNTAFK